MPETQGARERVIRLAFDGDERRYQKFVEILETLAPPGTKVILRGSAVTGERWEDGRPFDADGPGTSDLDVTFLSREMMEFWSDFHVPAFNTIPLSDENPDVCPPLTPFRKQLCELAGRPVNLQASSGFAQFARGVIWDQPYFTLIEGEDESDSETETA